MLKNYHAESVALSVKPNGLQTGMNSGYQAINLAVLLGVTTIVLLGFDMKPARDGKMHWFGDHPLKTNPAVFSAMLQHFPKTLSPLRQLGVEVINCTPDSALTCYRKEGLDETLACLVADQETTALPA